MIPSNELRIGNYVIFEGRLERLEMINNRTLVVEVEGANVDDIEDIGFSDIHPVLLTDDILRQCGFIYHDYFKFWQLVNGKDEHRSEMYIDQDYNVIDFMSRPIVRKVSSLHHLQNIYFMLKGQELLFQHAVTIHY